MRQRSSLIRAPEIWFWISAQGWVRPCANGRSVARSFWVWNSEGRRWLARKTTSGQARACGAGLPSACRSFRSGLSGGASGEAASSWFTLIRRDWVLSPKSHAGSVRRRGLRGWLTCLAARERWRGIFGAWKRRGTGCCGSLRTTFFRRRTMWRRLRSWRASRRASAGFFLGDAGAEMGGAHPTAELLVDLGGFADQDAMSDGAGAGFGRIA